MAEVDASEWWANAIKTERSKIGSPTKYVDDYLNKMSIGPTQILNDVEFLLVDARELIYESYLADEAILNRNLMKQLFESELPEVKQQVVSAFGNLHTGDLLLTRPMVEQITLSLVADLSGSCFEFIQALSTSNTNARRSRAGTTFERLFAIALTAFKVPFEDQNTLGSKFYKENNLGKKVDFVVPSASSYEISRKECAVVSAKTSLRERWQQVVEELVRSNVPHIYLATLGSDVTDSMLQIMKNYNITLVVPKAVRESHATSHNLMDFQTFFTELAQKHGGQN